MSRARQWWMITGLVTVVVLAAGWFLLVKPQRAHASSLAAQAQAAQQSNQTLETQIESLVAEQRNLPQEQQKLQQFETQVPTSVSEPSLIRQLSAAANAAGIDLTSITPGSPTAVSATSSTTTLGSSAAAGLNELPVSLSVSGSYANVESFFEQLEQLPRSTLVTAWSISAGGGSSGGSSGSSASSNAVTVSLTTDVFFQGSAASSTASSATSSTTS